MQFSRLVSLTSLIVFCALGLVIASSWATRHAIKGGPYFSPSASGKIVFLSKIPSYISGYLRIISELNSLKGVNNKYTNLTQIRSPKNDITGHLLISRLNSNGFNEVFLLDISSNKKNLLYSDHLKSASADNIKIITNALSSRQIALSSHRRIWNPYLSKNGSLIYAYPWNDLICLDLKTQSEKWRIIGSFHHSIESDSDGNLWVCNSSKPNSESKLRIGSMIFEDNIINKLSSDGEILDSISIHDLLCSNGLEYLVYGVSNPNSNLDPFHLNQVTPINFSSKFFSKGQILISLRNLSTILLIEPETRTVVWHKTGPWMNQHGVMLLNSSSISVLDNHSFASGTYWLDDSWRSRVLRYDFEENHLSEQVISESLHLRIATEGRAIPVGPDNWLIEDCAQGLVAMFRKGKLVFKWQNYYSENAVGITSWCRFITDSEYKEIIDDGSIDFNK
jgi:hypothetical protein